MNSRQLKDLSDFASVTVEVDGDGILGWVQDNLRPEDVFSTDDLDDWAERNGWVRA